MLNDSLILFLFAGGRREEFALGGSERDLGPLLHLPLCAPGGAQLGGQEESVALLEGSTQGMYSYVFNLKGTCACVCIICNCVLLRK